MMTQTAFKHSEQPNIEYRLHCNVRTMAKTTLDNKAAILLTLYIDHVINPDALYTRNKQLSISKLKTLFLSICF